MGRRAIIESMTMNQMCLLLSSWIFLGVLLDLPSMTRAEIRTFDMLLEPDDTLVHFTTGYIRGPGIVDLTNLNFTAISETMEGNDDDTIFGFDDDEPLVDDEVPLPPPSDDDEHLVDDDDENLPDDDEWVADDDEEDPGEGGGNLRRLDDAQLPSDSLTPSWTTVDIAIFHLPDECAETNKGCDWTKLGIGITTDKDEKQWCCNDYYKKLDQCGEVGHLIVSSTDFKGEHRFVRVPNEGPINHEIRYAKMEQKDSGQYVLIFANCNKHGRKVAVTGTSVWKSKHGYLPGELFGFMYFYGAVTCIYFLLLAFFGISMHIYQDSRIPIEKWIFMTIMLGLLEMFFRTGDYFVWNEDGYRQYIIGYVGLIAGVLKQGISRCLVVMVSMGWGVVRDSLGTTMRPIVLLGIIYCCTNTVRDLMVVFAIQDMETLSYTQESTLFDAATILTVVIACVDVTFIIWILDALNNTMEYLDMNNQTRKLMRFLRLRTLFLFAILFATIWAVFALVDTYDETGIVREEHEWVVDATTEINYLFVLIGVACLWRPNPNAKEYAYVMELPAVGAGEDGNELELTDVVPSAMDDDDDDDDDSEEANGDHSKKTGFRDQSGPAVSRFEID